MQVLKSNKPPARKVILIPYVHIGNLDKFDLTRANELLAMHINRNLGRANEIPTDSEIVARAFSLANKVYRFDRNYYLLALDDEPCVKYDLVFVQD